MYFHPRYLYLSHDQPIYTHPSTYPSSALTSPPFRGVNQMWALFTGALARGTSTTQVSIVNVSANFMFTAVLGFMIFTESLPPLWWLGAALLVAGTVIVGRRDEDQKSSGEGSQPPSPSSPRHTFVRTVEPRRGQPEGKALLQEGDDDGHEEVELVTDVGRASR